MTQAPHPPQPPHPGGVGGGGANYESRYRNFFVILKKIAFEESSTFFMIYYNWQGSLARP